MCCHPVRQHSHQERNTSSQNESDRSEQVSIDLSGPSFLKGNVDPNNSNKMRDWIPGGKMVAETDHL